MPIDLVKVLEEARKIQRPSDLHHFLQRLEMEDKKDRDQHDKRKFYQQQYNGSSYAADIYDPRYAGTYDPYYNPYHSPGLAQLVPTPIATKVAAPIVPHNTYRAGIRAWRAWRLTPDHRLRSVFKEHTWDGPKIESHKLPTHHDEAGIYAVKLTHPLTEYQTSPVEGEVLLYGRVLIFEQGYRAQNAMVKSLRIFPSRLNSPMFEPHHDVKEIAKNLERTYGCDVEICDAPHYSTVYKEVLDTAVDRAAEDEAREWLDNFQSKRVATKSAPLIIPTIGDYFDELRKADRNR